MNTSTSYSELVATDAALAGLCSTLSVNKMMHQLEEAQSLHSESKRISQTVVTGSPACFFLQFNVSRYPVMMHRASN